MQAQQIKTSRTRLTNCVECEGHKLVLMKHPEKDFDFYESTQENRLEYFRALERWNVALKDKMSRAVPDMPDHMAIRCPECKGSGYNSVVDVLTMLPFWAINGFMPDNLDYFFGRGGRTVKEWFDTFYRADAEGTIEYFKERVVRKLLSDGKTHQAGIRYETKPEINAGTFRFSFGQSKLLAAMQRRSLISLAAHILRDTLHLQNTGDPREKELNRSELLEAAQVLIAEAHLLEEFKDTDDLLQKLSVWSFIQSPIYEAGATKDDLPVDLASMEQQDLEAVLSIEPTEDEVAHAMLDMTDQRPDLTMLGDAGNTVRSTPEAPLGLPDEADLRVPVGGYGRVLDESDLDFSKAQRRDGDEVH
jgi:hypothetical protein